MRNNLPNGSATRLILLGVAMFASMTRILPGIPAVPEKESMTVDAVLDSLVEQFSRVDDYTARVKISVHMPRFRMPRKTVKLYFKRPDKVKVEADGFAVVPRSGLGMSPERIFRNLYNVQIVGHDIQEGRPHWVLGGIVHPDSLKFSTWSEGQQMASEVTMRLWVDSEGWVITRTETYLDTTNVMSVRTSYGSFDNRILLPTLTELTFRLSGKFLASVGDHEPLGGPFGEDHEGEKPLRGKDIRGRVRLEFSRYRINKGLKDRLFEETTF
ncbi:MAG: outer membrane lipoprotein carrier protein LolA [Fidelibacterota bacterium]